MWGNWFIVTLATHSSGVSRGIHHKCKHLLNPTRLYVFAWVESSLSVLIWKVTTCLGDVCVLNCESISVCIDEIFTAITYLICLSDCLVCCSSTFVMIINLLMWADARSTRGQPGRNDSAAQSAWVGHRVLFGIFVKAMAHVLLYPFILYLLLLAFGSCIWYVLTSWCASNSVRSKV